MTTIEIYPRWAAMTAAAMALLAAGGCAAIDAAFDRWPDPELIVEAPFALQPPAECFSRVPRWADLPDSDVTRSRAARLWRENKENYQSLASRRRICAGYLTALKEAE